MDRGAWQAVQSLGSQRVGHDLADKQQQDMGGAARQARPEAREWLQ